MTNGFKFDVAGAKSNMIHATAIDLSTGLLTVYAVMCINEDGASSHGGMVAAVTPGLPDDEDGVMDSLEGAILFAIDQNEYSEAGHTCKYVPVSFGFHPKFLPALNKQLFGLPVQKEDADFDITELDGWDA